MVTNCHKCIEHRKPNRESVISSAVPERPWQVLGTDLFSLNGRTYGTQFVSTRFDELSKDYLVHTCDVKPKAAASQWRGGASRTLIKNALKKEKDPAKALVSYKATPLENGYSPAQMLFGRKI